MEHRKPRTVSRKLDPEKQAAFIKAYDALLNRMDADEVVLFADAVHPTHAMRPVGCWAPNLFVDNARYHHAKRVQAWLARPGCRIKLQFVPTYCPHLDPIERLWGLMHKHITTPTSATRPSRTSETRSLRSCARMCPGTGGVTAMRSPITSVSSRPRIFGFWREQGTLRAGHTDFVLNDAAFDYMLQRALSAA
jgi:hypothetical protein